MMRSPKPEKARVPPHSIEAEQSVLGAMLLNPDAVGEAISILGPVGEGVFYLESHCLIYQAMSDLYHANIPVDAVTLLERLNKSKTLDDAGGVSYISKLTGCVPTSANIEYYSKIVRDAAVRRAVIKECAKLTADAFESTEPIDQLIDRVDARLFSLRALGDTTKPHRLSEFIDQVVARIERMADPSLPVEGYLYGLKLFDDLSCGAHDDSLITIAAGTSVGKSALALNVLYNMVKNSGVSGLIFSMEMPKNQVAERLFGIDGGIDLHVIRRRLSGKIGQSLDNLRRTGDRLRQMNIFVDDTPGQTVMDIRSKVRKHIAKHGKTIVVVDHLHIMRSMRFYRDEHREIAERTEGLKNLAREVHIPIIMLVQVSREAEKEPDLYRVMRMLKGSSKIEEDSDDIIVLQKPSAKDRKEMARKSGLKPEDYENMVFAGFVKNRQGPVGDGALLFLKDRQLFTNYTNIMPPSAAERATSDNGKHRASTEPDPSVSYEPEPEYEELF